MSSISEFKDFMSKLFFYRFFCLGLVLMIGGCQHFHNSESLGPQIVVSDNTNGKIEFSGKGSAAGPMLMTSLGPSGIAVGIAIDVGIGKEIKAAMDRSNPNWFAGLSTRFKNELPQICSGAENTNALCSEETLLVSIREIGFKTTGGKDDPTHPFLSFTLESEGNREVQRYVLETPELTKPLETLKSNGNLAIKMLMSLIEMQLPELVNKAAAEN